MNLVSEKVLTKPATSLRLPLSLAIVGVPGIVVAAISARSFSWKMVVAYLAFAVLVSAGLGLARITRGRVPAIILVVTVGALLTSPISPVAAWLSGVGGSVDFLSMITVMLTVAGLSLGKDLPMLRNIGWKIIPVGTVAVVASFVLATVVAEFVLGLWAH